MFFSDTQCSNIRSRGVSTDFRLGGPRWGAPLPSQLGDLGNAMLSPLRSAAQPRVSKLKKNIASGDKFWTWRELVERCSAVASALR